MADNTQVNMPIDQYYDNLASLFGVERRTAETDESLRNRLLAAASASHRTIEIGTIANRTPMKPTQVDPAVLGLPGSPQFYVDWDVSETQAEFRVHEFVLWHLDGSMGEFQKKGGSDTTAHCDLAEVYACGTIKWDACSHFYFGEGGYIHMCGLGAFKDHVALMHWLYNRAFELMKRKPDEEWSHV